jgi:hypothetical protein
MKLERLLRNDAHAAMLLSEAAPQIASAILEMARQHRAASPPLKAHYFLTLKWMARDLERFVTPRVSRAAQDRANQMDIGDLSRLRWIDQPVKMRDPGRKIFHWEHIVPTSDIARRIVTMDQPNVADITSILMIAGVAWILKAENTKLPLNGRADPLLSYAEAGIELLGC